MHDQLDMGMGISFSHALNEVSQAVFIHQVATDEQLAFVIQVGHK